MSHLTSTDWVLLIAASLAFGAHLALTAQGF